MAYIKKLRERVGHMPLIMTSASGALLNQQNQVLLQARADTGDWGFPGGYMEYGESFKQTLIREFKEDAGFLVRPQKMLGILDHDLYEYPNGDQVQPVNVLYLVTKVSDEQFAIKPSETAGLKFFALNNPPRFFNHQHEEMWDLVVNYINKVK